MCEQVHDKEQSVPLPTTRVIVAKLNFRDTNNTIL